MKLCKDCQWYTNYPPLYPFTAKCIHPKFKKSPVDGSTEPKFCDWERMDDIYGVKCGPEGKNWEEKEQ